MEYLNTRVLISASVHLFRMATDFSSKLISRWFSSFLCGDFINMSTEITLAQLLHVHTPTYYFKTVEFCF